MTNYPLSDLKIIYSWPSGQRDLDSVTTFLGKSVGYGHINGDAPPYIKFSRDDINSGPEIVEIDLQKAYLDGAIGSYPSITIPCHADWYATSSYGPATISWIYNGITNSGTIYPNNMSHAGGVFGTLVKSILINLDVPTGDPYPYNNDVTYEFDQKLNLDTGNLNNVTAGYSVHKYKDVQFSFNVTDRQLNELNSKSALLENPFVQSVDIDILSINGNDVYAGYVLDSFENTFTLTEQQNIDVFGSGEYTKDFGIRVSTISSNANIHISEHYVYANYLQIENILITDKLGVWLNDQPIGFQQYQPAIISETNTNAQLVNNNALYFANYYSETSGYNSYLSGDIAFGLLSGETLAIDWGDSTFNNIFQQTGSSGYWNINGTTSAIETDTGNALLINIIDPTGINGYTYTFETGHTYATTGVYNISLFHGVDGSGYQLIKQTQYKIPDELTDRGKPQTGDAVSGKIKFDIEFYNDPLYTFSDKLEIYIFTGISGIISPENLSKTIPVLSNIGNYSFYLDSQSLTPNLSYWFKIAPYSTLGSGYIWEVGPYSMYTAPAPKTNISTETLTIINGDEAVDIDLITGLITTTGITIIDTVTATSNNTVKYHEYLAKCKDSNYSQASKLLFTDNTGIASSLTEYSITDYQFINYSLMTGVSDIYLCAQTDNPPCYYKLYKTSI